MKIVIVNKIGEKVNKYKTETGASKVWIASQVGISIQSLNSIIKTDNITLNTLCKLATVLKCDPRELFDYQVEED